MGLQRVGHDWATELKWTDIHGSLNIPGLLKTQFIIVGWLEHILILNGHNFYGAAFYILKVNSMLDSKIWKDKKKEVYYQQKYYDIQSV